MSPDQLQVLAAVLGIIKGLGTWPVMSLIAGMILSPWIILVFIAMNQHKRFEAVVKMYEDNVLLVEEVIELGKGYRDHLIWSTQTVDKANSIAKNNLHCPAVRNKGN